MGLCLKALVVFSNIPAKSTLSGAGIYTKGGTELSLCKGHGGINLELEGRELGTIVPPTQSPSDLRLSCCTLPCISLWHNKSHMALQS
jgi:hypothetical protein